MIATVWVLSQGVHGVVREWEGGPISDRHLGYDVSGDVSILMVSDTKDEESLFVMT